MKDKFANIGLNFVIAASICMGLSTAITDHKRMELMEDIEEYYNDLEIQLEEEKETLIRFQFELENLTRN